MCSARDLIGLWRFREAYASCNIRGCILTLPQRFNGLVIDIACAHYIACHGTQQSLSQELFAEGLCPAGAQRHTMDDELTVIRQQRIILDLVAEHRTVTSLI